VRRTKLILVEGLPGSGKSTLAQWIAWQAVEQGTAIRWWYEEAAGHPVYAFDDLASLRRVVDALAGGRYGLVVEAALEQWARFAAGVRAGEEAVIIDSCLFGYLTWSLFPFEVPEGKIAAYVAAVAQAIAPLDPVVIYLRQDDVAHSLRRMCARRGAEMERSYIERATGSPYGRSRGLAGFTGMASYWTAYRDLTDRLFADLACPKVAIETTAGDWAAYQRRALAFLDLVPVAEPQVTPAKLADYCGRYRGVAGVGDSCEVIAEGQSLYVDGLPEVWRRTRLLPRGAGEFAVESLPIAARFTPDSAGRMRLEVTEAPMLGGAVAGEYERVSGEPACAARVAQ
jgi:thymidylate kinase